MYILSGVLIRSTADAREASQDASPGTLAGRWGNPLLGTLQQPTPTPSLPSRPPPIPPPRVPPSAVRSLLVYTLLGISHSNVEQPRLDRQQPPHLKRRISGVEAPPSSTRPKLDAPEVPTTSINTRPKQTPLPTSPRADRQRESATPIDPTSAPPQPMQEDATPLARAHPPTAAKPPEPQVPPSPREPGEMTPQTIPTPIPGPPSTGSGGASSTSRLPPPNHPPLSIPPRPPPSPYPSSSSSGNGDLHAPRRRDRDENRLTRELWDTRRQLTAIQAREQVILDDLERIGVRPENTGVDRSDVLREGTSGTCAELLFELTWYLELARLEDELKAERARRMRAERALNDVERECRTPFVVPALFQAFMSISELSN